MDQTTILDLNHFCCYEIFKQIKLSCEKNSETATPDEIKYVDLVNFTVCNRAFRDLFSKWDWDLSKRLFLIYVSSQEDLIIDFAELYDRWEGFSEKVKQVYWKSLALAIKENARLTSVDLRYYPKSHHREHLDVFETVMNELRKKKSLKALRMHIDGYTLEDLRGFGNLEELTLDMKTDIEELTRCCRENGNLRDLSVTNSDTAGRRLAEIVPFCCQVRVFAFKMKFDRDAGEYAPVAQMPRLEKLRIGGEHEQGTLQPLFGGLTRKEPDLLTTLSIDDAPLNWEESTELAQIGTLTDLRCRFLEPESIGPLVQLNYLNHLEILSSHDFKSIEAHIYTILKHSKVAKAIILPDCEIDYEPGQRLHILVRNQRGDPSEYSSLVSLPQIGCLHISGFHRRGSLVKLFEHLALGEVSSLIIEQSDSFRRDTGKRIKHHDPLLIDSDEVAALSKCKSLKRIVCGISHAANIELLAKLPELQDLNITHVPFKGSLVALFETLALADISVLQHFNLQYGTLNSEEISALSLIPTLKTLTVTGVKDIQMFSSLEIAVSLEKLNIFLYRKFDEVLADILKVLEICEFRMSISTENCDFVFDRTNKYLQIRYMGRFDLNKVIPLASLEWVESLDIDIGKCNIRKFLATLAMRTDGQLKKIRLESSLDFCDTLELAKMKSLKEFHGKLTDTRSLDHLIHLSFLGIKYSTGNRFPAHLVNILDSIEEELTIRQQDRQITYNIKTGHLTIYNSFNFNHHRIRRGLTVGMRPIIDASDLAPLASLKNLKTVTIEGNHSGGALQAFFAQLASRPCQTLEELAMERKKKGLKLEYVSINSSEIREVASIKSLRRLKCGFSESKHVELLAELPQLTELLITSHQVGSLKDLLAKLSSGRCPTLERLVLQEELLTPQESAEMSAIKSLHSRSAARPA